MVIFIFYKKRLINVPKNVYNICVVHDVKITVKDLTLAYQDYVVMNDISLEIQKGEVFFIMGGSGCGKSTFLKHLIGVEPVANGHVFYDNVDVNYTEQSICTTFWSFISKWGIMGRSNSS